MKFEVYSVEARLSALALTLLLAALAAAYFVAFHIARHVALADFSPLPTYASEQQA